MKPERSHVARWHTHVNAANAPLWMRDWLTGTGSLTARLVAHSHHFRVQKLSQRAQICLNDEFAEIGLPRRQRVTGREVLLRCDGEAVVYAHTIVPLTATASEWPLFAALGERSLGTTLFNDPLVQRAPLQFARIDAAHPLWQRLREQVPEQELPQRLFARRSVFRRKGGCLLVTEIFLPALTRLRHSVLKMPAPATLHETNEPRLRFA